MARKTWKSGIAAVAAALLFAALPAAAAGDDLNTISKSFKVDPGGKLVVDTDLGSIDVRGGDGHSVEITVTREVRRGDEEKILADFKLNFEQRGNDVYVSGERDRHGFLSRFWDDFGNRLRVNFTITVPKPYDIDLKTSGGGIEVENVRGRVDSRTSGGSLSFDKIQGDVFGKTSGGSIRIGAVDGRTEARTSGGDIKINETKGDVLARTSGGSVRIVKAGGEVDAHTSGGSVTVEEVMGTLNAGTSGGSVTATISVQPKARCELTTSGGSITIYLAESIGMEVDAHSSGGSVSTDFPVTIQGKIERDSLRAKINGGGPELYLRTSGGGIRIRKK